MNSTPAGEIRDIKLSDALSERYLSYALSTIMARSLPDVRDGLKPVHRRLLYAMRQLRLDPNTGFKKSARVVGDVIGKFHPHGDQAIYDALVRLAQDFSLRFPLIDGQGNFGNVDGDNAAAMRYTEARLTEVAAALLDGIDADAVDFRPTYDGEAEEPVVLPAAFPNLLANGAQGIAVGMATSIPPHNVGELCDALLHLIKAPNATFDKLVDLVPGPDFPTGGILVEARESIVDSYKTGRGSFRLRARWEAEKIKGGSYQIVVTEIPFQVQKSRLIEKIAELLLAKKLAMLADIRDESTEEIRLVLEPKSRNVDPEVLMESLFRQTDLETRVGLNMNVLDADNTPRVMNLREALRAFLDHRHEVLKRTTRFRLAKIEHRLEVLDGYLIAYLNIDEVIRIIREEDDPKARMMKRWKLSDVQAEAILNMRLRALRKLEEISIREEHAALSKEQKDLKQLLRNEKRRWTVIGEQVKEIRDQFGAKTEIGARRTEIGAPPSEVVIPLEAVVEREPVTVLCSAKGWVRSLKGHQEDVSDAKYKEGDRERFAVHAQTTDKLLVFATNGRFYTLGVDKLPGGRGFGEPLRLMMGLPNDQDIVGLQVHEPGRRLLVASADGRGFIVPEDEVVAQTKNGKQVLNLAEGVEAAVCRPVSGDHVAVVGENRKLIIFPLDELPEMTRGRGVIMQKYKDGGLSDAKTFTLADGLTWSSGAGRTRTESDLVAWVGKRAQAGRLPPTGFSRANKFG
ncbi:DNA topoisomerase IV subunit A [Pelagibius sp.]|uniref:DNA topoisomerase IV subunit A n=1 Tax=Pelagibius sp. TaxID=1931238 RepID=UPI002624A484|nr:DNA topoisomerase IV subunit A [Pelagibius sp.]